MSIQNYIKNELKSYSLELTCKTDGRKGVDFLIGNNETYLKSINLDSERSVKISKQELGALKNNLFIALVLNYR